MARIFKDVANNLRNLSREKAVFKLSTGCSSWAPYSPMAPLFLDPCCILLLSVFLLHMTNVILYDKELKNSVQKNSA